MPDTRYFGQWASNKVSYIYLCISHTTTQNANIVKPDSLYFGQWASNKVSHIYPCISYRTFN